MVVGFVASPGFVRYAVDVICRLELFEFVVPQTLAGAAFESMRQTGQRVSSGCPARSGFSKAPDSCDIALLPLFCICVRDAIEHAHTRPPTGQKGALARRARRDVEHSAPLIWALFGCNSSAESVHSFEGTELEVGLPFVVIG